MMSPETLAILIKALNAYFATTGNVLVKNAYQTTYQGTIAADLSLGVKVGSPYYSNVAQAYAEQYSDLLINQGGSYVYDQKADQYQFKPWFAQAGESTREEISDIIERGIREGKPPGQKQLKGGGYPKGSIAADIDQVMDGKKSWASTVARTEGANITNHSRLEQLRNRGVRQVRVYDNEGPHSCRRCAQVNQQVWDIDFAMEHKLEHPNCVRRFQAILTGVTITAKAEEILPYHAVLMKAGAGLLA